MGIQQSVNLPNGIPLYEEVRDLLDEKGFNLQMAVIDGELTFPDEVPKGPWSEIRVKTPSGMVTVRSADNRVDTVTWGNADDTMLQAWNAVTWGFAAAGNGTVINDSGQFSSEEFLSSANLPESFS